MALGDIGMAILDQPGDQPDHVLRRVRPVDILGRPRLDGGRQAAERRDVLVELRRRALRDEADRFVERQVRILLRRPRVDLVVDVGDVADIGDVVRPVEVPEQAEQHVEDDQRPGVADMGEVVDRRPADVHAHVRRIDRNEVILRPRQRVVKHQTHAETCPSPAGRGSRLYLGRVKRGRPQPASVLAGNNDPRDADRAEARQSRHARVDGGFPVWRQGRSRRWVVYPVQQVPVSAGLRETHRSPTNPAPFKADLAWPMDQDYRCRVRGRNSAIQRSFFHDSIPAMPTDPLSILKTVYGYDAFRGQQREIIEHVIAGNSAFVLMPTGGASRSATRFRRWSARASASSCRP